MNKSYTHIIYAAPSGGGSQIYSSNHVTATSLDGSPAVISPRMKEMSDKMFTVFYAPQGYQVWVVVSKPLWPHIIVSYILRTPHGGAMVLRTLQDDAGIRDLKYLYQAWSIPTLMVDVTNIQRLIPANLKGIPYLLQGDLRNSPFMPLDSLTLPR